MKPYPVFFRISLGVAVALLAPLYGHAAPAANAMVRITCEEADKGAEVQVDGKFKGECPVDIMLPEGAHKFRVIKKFDDIQDQVFEQEVRLGGGTSKKIDVVLSAPQLNAAAKRAADASNGARYKKAEAALTLLMQQAANGDSDAKKELATNYSQDAKGCYFYTPIYASKETVSWTGGCRNGLTSGSGDWSRFREGALFARYTGLVVAGREEGPGTIEYIRGEKYVGNFTDGFRSGKGAQYLDNGRYEGNFTKGLRHGTGTYYWNIGDRYEGAWEYGMLSGVGTYYESDGTRYEGEYQKNKRNGKGTLFFPDGDRWVGSFEAGQQKDGRLIKKGD